METYKGLVLAERNAGDRGKFIDILTENNTVQEVYVRGAKKASSAATSLTQLFSYAVISSSATARASCLIVSRSILYPSLLNSNIYAKGD